MSRKVRVGNVTFGGGRLVLIAGPCVIEGEASTLRHAEKLKRICSGLKVPLIFKSSYEKANRTSVKSYRGPGLAAGLGILAKVKEKFGLPVTSDVHCREEIPIAAGVLDMIQIPAFLSRQTEMLVAAGKSGVTVNIKKGQFLAPWDIRHAISKVESAGNRDIVLTERGTSFGYNNLVADMRSLTIIAGFGYPVVFDATHSIQLPGSGGGKSGGDRRFVPPLVRAAVAVGVDGIFLEVHENPDRALCDGPNSLKLASLKALLEQALEINEIVKK
jgi:2-dehydro-3-deoxyphosphooctonate aldolase (KDO 8-P synthase)